MDKMNVIIRVVALSLITILLSLVLIEPEYDDRSMTVVYLLCSIVVFTFMTPPPSSKDGAIAVL